MRVWPWIAAAAVLAVTVASCLTRAPSHRADAQPTAAADAAAAGERAAKEGAPARAPESASAPAPAKPEAEPTTHEVVLEHADRVRYDNKTKDYTLTGNIVLRHEDGMLRAQNAVLNRETKKGVVTGELSFANEQTVLTAKRLEIDFDARIAKFTDDVRMVSQKKPEQAETKGEAAAAESKSAKAAANGSKATAAAGGDKLNTAVGNDKREEEKPFRDYWKDRTEITCPELEYFYREHRAVARKGVAARQKDRAGRADEAVYNDRDELLVLTGNVEMKNERGETFRADKLTISVKDDWLEAEGAIGSRFMVEEKKDEEKGKTAQDKSKPALEKEAPAVQK
jgi:lipopolysaccharide assembly outer membrane protein LptD (OstA)